MNIEKVREKVINVFKNINKGEKSNTLQQIICVISAQYKSIEGVKYYG